MRGPEDDEGDEDEELTRADLEEKWADESRSDPDTWGDDDDN